MTKLCLFLGVLSVLWGGQAWLGGEASAAPRCKRISGEVVLTPVSGPDCNSAVSICGAGKLTGSLAGTSFFVGSSLEQNVDTPSTSVVLLTGDNRIETRRGALLTKDAIVLRTSGDGEFAEVDTIVGGTGGLAGATGVFTATGLYSAAIGGSGIYEGELCLP